MTYISMYGGKLTNLTVATNVERSLLPFLESNSQPQRHRRPRLGHERPKVSLDQMKRAVLELRNDLDELIFCDELQFRCSQLPEASCLGGWH